eukprot:scaffold32684_cov69-Phaeocystis_antarctica.AAC.3
MSVSDSSRYIRSRAQYAAKWCVVVTVEPPKGTEGITRHDEASLSQHMAAETGGWRRPSKRSVAGVRTVMEPLYGLATRRRLKTIEGGWLAR